MFELNTTPIILRQSIEGMNDAVTALEQRYEPAFCGQELIDLVEQAKERIQTITRELWRELPEDDHEVSYSAIIHAYDEQYDF